ncbi:MAG: OmpA family protein [Rhodothermales bacterium]|nr:OmpA family protein [Rhodothermales bacterium]
MLASRFTVVSHVVLVGCLALAAAGTGCSGSKVLLAEQEMRIDSLQALNASLALELETYRDSIAFYDFIDSGEFDRDMRFKAAQVNRLTYELAVCLDGGDTFATELVDDLFSPASATLTESGRERLALLADTVLDRASSGIVYVAGFSDSSRPAGTLKERFPSNWELSAARAAAVVRYFTEEHGIKDSRLLVLSYGASRPIASNASRRGQRLNRRIVLSFMPVN